MRILEGCCQGSFYGIESFSVSAPFILFIFGSIFIWTNAFAGAFTPFGKIAGYAGAMYSFIQSGGAAILGSIAAFSAEMGITKISA